jgi:type II secretory pathway pseudopilin PulG
VASRTRSRQDGFSYIEVLVGIMILALVAGGIAQGLGQTSGALGGAKVDTTATKLASAALDQAHRMPYEDLGIQGGSPPGTIPATTTTTVAGIEYRIDSDVEYVDDPALGQPQTYVNYKKVTVTVTPQTDRGRPYTQTTVVAPPAIGAIAGKATIIVTVIDAITDEPVAGAPVTADQSTSPTQTRATGPDGKVVFAGLLPSALDPSDPKYKYRLTVGLGDPWVTHPDSAPEVAQQHLAASQTWTTTLKVFKRATVEVNLRDSQTGQLIGEHSEVVLSTPEPDVLSEAASGTSGTYTFTEINGKPIQPSTSNFRVDAEADCYASKSVEGPVPSGYPSSTTEVFDLAMQRVPSGVLEVTVRSIATGNPVIAGARVQVSGGQASLGPRVRTTDSNGVARFCLPPSGSVTYVVSAVVPGYGAGSILAVVELNRTTSLTMYLVPGSNLGDVRLTAGASNRLVRLQALTGTYDASQITNRFGHADFTGLAAGNYMAYIATGFSGGEPTWSSGKLVQAVGGQLRTYSVP